MKQHFAKIGAQSTKSSGVQPVHSSTLGQTWSLTEQWWAAGIAAPTASYLHSSPSIQEVKDRAPHLPDVFLKDVTCDPLPVRFGRGEFTCADLHVYFRADFELVPLNFIL